MWWSDEQWAGLTAAESCGMCVDAHRLTNEHSVLVTAGDLSFVRLSRNQAHPGYSVVILREHVTDLTVLSALQLAGFWSDVQRAARAIQTVFAPKKIDYLVMGHRMPHLHCHLLPQHIDDDPYRNPDIADGPAAAKSAELDEAATALRRAWATEPRAR